MSRERYLGITEAARRLGVHPNTLRAWADEGRIPHVMLPSGHRRFAVRDISRLAGDGHGTHVVPRHTFMHIHYSGKPSANFGMDLTDIPHKGDYIGIELATVYPELEIGDRDSQSGSFLCRVEMVIHVLHEAQYGAEVFAVVVPMHEAIDAETDMG